MPDSDPLSAALLEALPYINYFAGKTVVIKIGGSTLGSGDTTRQDVVWLKSLGIEPVLVHGGGNAITDWLGRIGKQARFVRGLRVTDEETMEVVRMTLAGKVNTELVATLNALGGRAVGITGLDGKLIQEAGFGDGPVDATFKTIKKITRTKSKLLQFAINAITSGTEAQGEVTVRLEEKGYAVIGQGADTDVIVASAKAYINALNKMEFKKQKFSGM